MEDSGPHFHQGWSSSLDVDLQLIGWSYSQVTLETVLNDKDGMHLGAGPFLLIYSRSLSEPLISEWPNVLKVSKDPQETLVSIED